MVCLRDLFCAMFDIGVLTSGFSMQGAVADSDSSDSLV